MIAVIDYNMGNLRSVHNAFDKIGKRVEIINDAQKLSKFDKIVLPGVGAYKDAMDALRKNGMLEAIIEFANSGKPLLGICLGMQLLLQKSYEFGESKGLGLIEGEVVEFDKSKFPHRLKVPHMGWNKMIIQKDSPLLDGLGEDVYLYFVHSFHAKCDEKYAIGKTLYGYEFVSALQKDNIFGFQPHPEKSHINGLKILENFINYKG
jgi:glutamine amidotransferase